MIDKRENSNSGNNLSYDWKKDGQDWRIDFNYFNFIRFIKFQVQYWLQFYKRLYLLLSNILIYAFRSSKKILFYFEKKNFAQSNEIS